MRSADAHLTPQELQDLLFAAGEPNVTTADPVHAREAQQHLDGCDVCKGMARKYANADSLLKALGPRKESLQQSDASRRRSDCPPDDIWLRLAAGLIDDAAASSYVSHAARCDYCGPLLKEAMQDLADDMTVEEEAAIDSLPSAGVEWQREMGRKLAAATRPDSDAADKGFSGIPAQVRKHQEKRNKLFLWPRYALAAAGVLVVAVAVWVAWQKAKLPRAERLLSQAYTEQRRIELRIPGAAYSAKQAKRGPGMADLPGSFYVATGIIKDELSKHPGDPAWLQAQARAHLLAGDYENAIGELDEALLAQPIDSGLLRDRATALYERAESLGPSASIDYGYATEDLTLVLKKNPDDLVALFNRAILYDKLNMPNEAIGDLQHYLKIEPSSAWADEVRKRLQKLRTLLQTHDSAKANPRSDPAAFLRLMADPRAAAQIDERIEDYLTLAITKWLPSSTLQGPESPEALAALHALGGLLATKHDDDWLNDFLTQANHSAAYASAVRALADAISGSRGFNASEALSAAENADRDFARLGNQSGRLRAQVQQVYALQRLQRSKDCLAKSDLVELELKKRHYAWMSSQLQIDDGACALKVGDLARAWSRISSAGASATIHRFPVLLLRAEGIGASVRDVEGDLAAAWGSDEEGLSQYWSRDSSPVVRAHQFYDDLTRSAEKMDFVNLAVAFAEESAKTVSASQNVTGEILARRHLAEVAARAGLYDFAKQELKKARTLETQFPSAAADLSSSLYSQITLAEIYMHEGLLTEAEAELRTAEPQLHAVNLLNVTLRFERVKGELLALRGHKDDAETVLRRAIGRLESAPGPAKTAGERDYWTEDNSDLYRSLVSLELTRGDGRRALAVWEWYQARNLEDTSREKTLDHFLEGNRVSAMVSTLSADTVLVYAVLPRGLAIWVADDGGLDGRFIDLDSAELLRLASSFLNMCADPRSDVGLLNMRARRLFDILISPIKNKLAPGRTLIIEADSLLGDLPFQALMGKDGRFLAEDRAIVFSPGLLYYSGLRPPAALSSKANPLIVGSTAAWLKNVSFQPDDSVVAEANETAARFSHPTLLTGAEATAEALDTKLPASDVFHFGGHALSTVEQEGLIVFTRGAGSQNTVLWDAKRARPALFKKCQLVVLSACSTGRVLRTRREGHGQMVRSILSAGVPSVIASRWDVDSIQTRKLVRAFYTALFDGKPAVAALRAAELELIGNSETRHPYYWAAFAAFGRS